jgi:hypothetical protein
MTNVGACFRQQVQQGARSRTLAYRQRDSINHRVGRLPALLHQYVHVRFEVFPSPGEVGGARPLAGDICAQGLNQTNGLFDG